METVKFKRFVAGVDTGNKPDDNVVVTAINALKEAYGEKQAVSLVDAYHTLQVEQILDKYRKHYVKLLRKGVASSIVEKLLTDQANGEFMYHIHKVCKQCKKVYVPSKSAINRQKYCSWDCHRQHTKDKMKRRNAFMKELVNLVEKYKLDETE